MYEWIDRCMSELKRRAMKKMSMCVVPSSAFLSTYQITLLGELASLWWDGEKKLPFLQVDAVDGITLVYSGAILNNHDIQYNPVVRVNFTNKRVLPLGYKLHFTLPETPDLNTLYYSLDENGTSIQIDRLIINESMSVKCGFHVLGLSNGKKLLVCRYEFL